MTENLTLSAGITGMGLSVAQSLPGFCTAKKARWLYDLVLKNRPSVVVEVGVFGGRSLVPMALACRQNETGVIYGIDTWREIEYLPPTAEDPHVNPRLTQTDLDGAYRELLHAIIRLDLASVVRIVGVSSPMIVHSFKMRSVDLIHIDGSHTKFDASADVYFWLSRLKPSGLIVMDDTDWKSVQPALQKLGTECDLVEDHGQYCLYRKKSGPMVPKQ